MAGRFLHLTRITTPHFLRYLNVRVFVYLDTPLLFTMSPNSWMLMLSYSCTITTGILVHVHWMVLWSTMILDFICKISNLFSGRVPVVRTTILVLICIVTSRFMDKDWKEMTYHLPCFLVVQYFCFCKTSLHKIWYLVWDTLSTNTTLNFTNPMKVSNTKCKLKH